MAEQSYSGLSLAEVEQRQIQYGENSLGTKKRVGPFWIFIKKFNSPLLLLLIGVSVVSIIMGQRTDAVIILLMVFVSAILDFVNTQKSAKAVESLIAKVAITTRVKRGGVEVEIPVKNIVPGDIVLLSAGDVVPADCRVLEARDFFINQSALTGESFPVEKIVTEPENLIFMGSNVITGFATVEVLTIGLKTQYGNISANLSTAEEETDFEQGIRKFSYFILRVTFVLVVFVFFINAFFHRGIFESFIFALAIAIGLTPELLPVVISVALSRGSVLMSKKGVIVKRLSSIQNLGSMNVLCTDKTGTLTEDRIELVKYVDGFGEVSEAVLQYSYLNSFFHTGVQNPLDNAIKNFKNIDISNYQKVDEIPFDFMRRCASMVVEEKENSQRYLITKGAPEDILAICLSYQKHEEIKPLQELPRRQIRQEFESLSKNGFRVLAVAYKKVVDGQKQIYKKEEEKDLIFMGFVAFYDPPKQTAAEAVKELGYLGIEVKIITGDNELLASKICSEIGLPVKGVVTGEELHGKSDEEIGSIAVRTTIFARINPAQKERIIRSLRKAKFVVGYLGDGINDAPALKAADVGISVNNAVDVAKDTADIILLRKSLRVLRDGVVEGRKTFQNTMKYIMMGLSSNFGNMFSMAGLPLFIPFFPMLPSQILFNNFLYDISQFTIPTDKVDKEDIQKPLRWDLKFIRKYMYVFGSISSIFDFGTFALMWFIFHPSVAQFQTAWFMESLATQTFVIYVIRTRKFPFLQSSPSKWLLLSTLLVVVVAWIIPFIGVGRLLHFSALTWPMMVGIFVLVFIYLILVQIVKMIFYKYLAHKFVRGTHA